MFWRVAGSGGSTPPPFFISARSQRSSMPYWERRWRSASPVHAHAFHPLLLLPLLCAAAHMAWIWCIHATQWHAPLFYAHTSKVAEMLTMLLKKMSVLLCHRASSSTPWDMLSLALREERCSANRHSSRVEYSLVHKCHVLLVFPMFISSCLLPLNMAWRWARNFPSQAGTIEHGRETETCFAVLFLHEHRDPCRHPRRIRKMHDRRHYAAWVENASSIQMVFGNQMPQKRVHGRHTAASSSFFSPSSLPSSPPRREYSSLWKVHHTKQHTVHHLAYIAYKIGRGSKQCALILLSSSFLPLFLLFCFLPCLKSQHLNTMPERCYVTRLRWHGRLPIHRWGWHDIFLLFITHDYYIPWHV